MTHTTTFLAALAEEEAFAWAAHAQSVSDRADEMFLGNAQGGEADFDDYEVRQSMALGL